MAVCLGKQSFEEKFPEIAQTELWKIFRKKANKEGYSAEFVSAVSRICELGLEKSKTIMTFFPTFTLHDNTHIRNICDWMFWLLGGRKENGKVKKGRAKDLTTREAAMLLMSACCHDIGMSVDEDQKKQLKIYNDKWQKYFEKNVEDQLLYNKAKAEKENKKADKKDKSDKDKDEKEIELITEEMLRNYVRSYHHERIEEIISPDYWGRELTDNGLYLFDLITLCKSHGESLNSLHIDAPLSFDMRLCAVLLRLADILDFDPTRAPDSLFKHMKLDEPTNKETNTSSREFKKNAVGKFIVSGNNITYSASMDDPRLRKEVEGYIDWVNYELTSCRQYIKTYNTPWKDLILPENIIPRIDMNYCESGEFMITMEQDNIINLLKGENLYSDKYVFVRELLQNAIDAVLWRKKIDKEFNAKNEGKIKITTWIDKDNGQGWFRIEDNGTGMNVEIIKKYFLTIGRSYYQSDDFKRDGNGKTEYNPISRFGIGILSCFLTDENNTLEVSTKRAGSPAVRLSVTGLKGLYRLAAEGSTIGKDDWQKMPKKSGEDDLIYRTEPGTTICVGLNLFYLEGYNSIKYNSIKDVVDKYVKFPDMPVEYEGAEGRKTYTTKGELLTAIKNLKKEEIKNGRSVFPIERKYDIPQQYVKELKKWNPDFDWDNNCPKIIFTYYPFDVFSEENETNPNLSGISIHYEIDKKEGKLKVTEKEEYEYRLFAYIYIDSNKRQINMRWECLFGYYDRNNIQDNEGDNIKAFETLNGVLDISIPFDELKLSEDEKNILVYTPKVGSVAYNGVLAEQEQDISLHSNTYVILFGNEYVPTVNVSRDHITNLPFKAAVETNSIIKQCLILKRLQRSESDSVETTIIIKQYLNENRLYSLDYLYKTEKEIKSELKDKWEDFISVETDNRIIKLSEVDNALKECSITLKWLDNNSLCDNIALTFLKQNYSLTVDEDGYLTIAGKDTTIQEIDTSEFPVQLFFEFSDGKKLVAICYEANYYNVDHWFSQWLINNREKLQTEVNPVYKRILQIMIESKDKETVMQSLNSILDKLKGYKNNMFNIQEKRLTKDDFINEELCGNYSVILR